MTFEYSPLVGSNTAGDVGMAIQYDVADTPLPDIKSLFGYEGATTGTLWNALRGPFKVTSEQRKRYYCRPGAQPMDTDLRLYDVGNFNIIVANAPATTNVGRLLVSYDVVFTVPKIPAVATLLSSIGAEYVYTSGSGVFTIAAPLGIYPAKGSTSDSKGAIVNAGTFTGQPPLIGDGKSFALDAGVWSIAYDLYNNISGLNAWTASGTGSSGLALPGSASVVTANVTSTVSGITAWWVVSVLTPALIALSFTASSPIVFGSNSFYMTPYNPNLVPGNPLMSEIRSRKSRYLMDQKNSLDRPSEEKEMSKEDSPIVVDLPPRSSRGVSKKRSENKGDNVK